MSEAAAEARRICGIFTALLVPWGVFLVVVSFIGERSGAVPFVVPLWNLAYTVGMVMVCAAVFRGRAWGWEWAFSAAVMNGIFCLFNARDGDIVFILGAALHLSALLVLHRRKREFVTLATLLEGLRGARFQQRLSLAVIAIGVTVSIMASRGTDGSRRKFARAMQQRYSMAEIYAQGDRLFVNYPASERAAAEKSIERLRRAGKQAVFWDAGFASVSIAYGDETTVIRRP